MPVEPLRGAGEKAERDDHRVGRHNLLRPGNRLRHAAPAGVGFPEARLDELDPFDPLGADDLDRLTVEEELDALFLAVLVVAPGTRHVALVTTIGAGNGFRTLANGGAIAVHAGIAAAQHYDTLAAHADQ